MPKFEFGADGHATLSRATNPSMDLFAAFAFTGSSAAAAAPAIAPATTDETNSSAMSRVASSSSSSSSSSGSSSSGGGGSSSSGGGGGDGGGDRTGHIAGSSISGSSSGGAGRITGVKRCRACSQLERKGMAHRAHDYGDGCDRKGQEENEGEAAAAKRCKACAQIARKGAAHRAHDYGAGCELQGSAASSGAASVPAAKKARKDRCEKSAKFKDQDSLLGDRTNPNNEQVLKERWQQMAAGAPDETTRRFIILTGIVLSSQTLTGTACKAVKALREAARADSAADLSPAWLASKDGSKDGEVTKIISMVNFLNNKAKVSGEWLSGEWLSGEWLSGEW